MSDVINGVVSEYEMPREPKFHMRFERSDSNKFSWSITESNEFL